MAIWHSAFAGLQKIGKALMLPVSVLPLAGILLGVGSANFIFLPDILSSIMAQAGGAVFGQMALLFAVGVALGFSKNDGVAALAAIVGYAIMLKTLEVMAKVHGLEGIETGVLGGILVGAIAGYSFNKFHKIKLPDYLGFFAGKRFVPIVVGFFAIFLALILSFIWPPIGLAIESFSNWAAYQSPTLAFTIYGMVERALIPFGMHHIWNVPFFYEAGSYISPETGTEVKGVLQRYLAGDPSAGQLAGAYMFKMYGLPAAAIAIWHSAKPENRVKVGGIMISAALTSFLTGITEPIEFAFLFVAPVLYVIHIFLAGSAFFVTNSLEMVHGTSFSHGLIDFIVLSANSSKFLLFPAIGLIYAAIYYVLFRVVITKLDLKTPGREDTGGEQDVKISTNLDPNDKISQLVFAFGGAQNIKDLDNCITRLRIEVSDIDLVKQETIKTLGATGVIIVGNNVQAIFGTEAEHLKTSMQEALLNPIQSKQKIISPAVDEKISKSNITKVAKLIVEQFGGEKNIKECIVCATSRIRFEFKTSPDFDEELLLKNGIKHLVKISDKVVHLLVDDNVEELVKKITKLLK